MENKTIFIIIGILVFSICIFPVGIALLFFIFKSLDNQSLGGTLQILCFSALCIIPVLAAIAALGLQLVQTLRAPNAGGRLAGEIGLSPLNESPKAMGVWYGGDFDKRRIAIKPFGSTYRYYSMDRSRTGVNFNLRLVMEVRLPAPLGIIAYRGSSGASRNPQNFSEAFEVENAEKLSEEARAALFEFVQKGYRTGFHGVNLRFSKGYRNLWLRDRATAPEGLLGDMVMPDAAAILVHDHPDTGIDKEYLLELLNDMATVCYAIEKTKIL